MFIGPILPGLLATTQIFGSSLKYACHDPDLKLCLVQVIKSVSRKCNLALKFDLLGLAIAKESLGYCCHVLLNENRDGDYFLVNWNMEVGSFIILSSIGTHSKMLWGGVLG